MIKADMINSNKISSEFKEKIRSSVPSDFDLGQIGKIDLREAEQIAREEVIFLKEEDLIEGLEEFELIPLKENVTIPEPTAKADKPEIRKEAKLAREDDLIADSIDEDVLIFDDVQPSDLSSVKTADLTEPVMITPDESEFEHPEKIEPVVSVNEAGIKTRTINAEKSAEPVEDIAEKTSSERSVQEFASELETIPADNVESITQSVFSEEYQHIPDISEIDEVFEDEFLPEKYSDISKKSNVSFIDDKHISRERDFSITVEDDQLTTRLSKMIDIAKGKSRIVESDADLFNNRYNLEDLKTYEYKDEVLYEEKFLTDTDFDFIDNSIIKEDFIQYIQEIDEYYSTEEKYSLSEISAIMGFERDEDKIFRESLFGEYFKNIDIDSEIEFINPGLDFYTRSISDKKDMIYLLEDPESLKDDERYSIEADISSDSAIVFEESIKDIESMLGDTSEHVIVEKEYVQDLKPAEIKTVQDDEPVVFEDITDKVIILDDLDNINEFMETIPEKKEDLTRLLAYLDGLFEKLPEDAVRKFADSEYFDLYVKVMKDMGV